jgi:hypothetical protein
MAITGQPFNPAPDKIDRFWQSLLHVFHAALLWYLF